MKKLGLVSIDLSTVVGSMEFVPGVQLPRNDKRMLEMIVARSFLELWAETKGLRVASLRSNEDDPPDLLFECEGQLVGLELTELVPESRLEKDAQIRQLRKEILSVMSLGPESQDHVVHIDLVNDYAPQLNAKRLAGPLARLLESFLSEQHGDEMSIPVPEYMRDVVKSIWIQRSDLEGDSRIQHRNEPLVLFGAQNTFIIPSDDCPAMAKASLDRKRIMKVTPPAWLILWSNHQALAGLRDELDDAIGHALQQTRVSFERVFHVHLFPGSGATEFPMPQSLGGKPGTVTRFHPNRTED